MAERWRFEADDEWLAAHSSDSFGRLRRRLRPFGRFADAVSLAELGPFGGAPRNPKLKVGGRAYALVRYAEHYVSHTRIQVVPDRCRRCGHRLAERHVVTRVRETGRRVVVGSVRTCRRCQAGSWMFFSHMPTVARARRVASKVVL
ncbi:MAG TPA: hypothetical protein VJT31_30405 [Rugosimonospora sp.]|nr:hypothetical protein [Rugosimonospora sp.]